jgi:hypothetical protein
MPVVLTGFWDFVTLFKEDYEKAKQGNLVDADFDAYSDSGISLSRRLGLKFLCEHKEEGEIYIGSMKNLIKHPLAKDFIQTKQSILNLRILLISINNT